MLLDVKDAATYVCVPETLQTRGRAPEGIVGPLVLVVLVRPLVPRAFEAASPLRQVFRRRLGDSGRSRSFQEYGNSSWLIWMVLLAHLDGVNLSLDKNSSFTNCDFAVMHCMDLSHGVRARQMSPKPLTNEAEATEK